MDRQLIRRLETMGFDYKESDHLIGPVKTKSLNNSSSQSLILIIERIVFILIEKGFLMCFLIDLMNNLIDL